MLGQGITQTGRAEQHAVSQSCLWRTSGCGWAQGGLPALTWRPSAADFRRASVHPALCPSCGQRAPRRRAVCPIVPASFIIGARCPEYIPRCQPWRWRKMGCLAHEKKCSILAPLLANWLQRVLDVCLGPRRMGTQSHRPSQGPGGQGHRLTGSQAHRPSRGPGGREHRPEGPPGTQEYGVTGSQALPGPRRMGTQAHRPSRGPGGWGHRLTGPPGALEVRDTG